MTTKVKKEDEAKPKIDRTKQIAAARQYLIEVAGQITHPVLRQWCFEIIRSDDFQTCTASKRIHQAYEGGLMVHTAEVMQLAMAMAGTVCVKANLDVIITSIIFHDVGKTFDYKTKDDGTFEYTKHQELVRHLPRSYAIFMSRTSPHLDEETRLQIAHCIMSHHGRQEWGSPVLPQTPEAYLVHCADWISSNSTMDYWE